MPTLEATAPANPWHDWMPEGGSAPDPGDMISREELIDRLQADGITVTPRQLHYWETEGALPKPVKRSHTGAIRAVYPTWVLPLVPRVQALRQQGVPLREIGSQLRKAMDQGVEGITARITQTTIVHSAAHGVDVDDKAALAAFQPTTAAVQRVVEPIGDEIGPALEEMARQHFAITGKKTVYLDIVFRDEERRALVTVTRYPDIEPPS